LTSGGFRIVSDTLVYYLFIHLFNSDIIFCTEKKLEWLDHRWNVSAYVYSCWCNTSTWQTDTLHHMALNREIWSTGGSNVTKECDRWRQL